MHYKYSLLLILLFQLQSFAQKIDNTVSFRSSLAEEYFRFNYDNDFFAANDYYYTQGYSFEFGSKALKKSPFSKILIKSEDSLSITGIALEHIGFTPTSISREGILVGDRPFAAFLMLKSYTVFQNPTIKSQISSSFSFGMMGPIAFGGAMQKTIHRWIGDEEPKGWQHQIRNDVVLNYEMNLEKLFLNTSLATLSSAVNVRVGTLNTKMQTGLIFTVGKYTSVLDKSRKKGRSQLFFYAQPLMNLVAYDATLQGGLFSASPYTLKASEISRLNFQSNFGLIFKSRKLDLEYTRSIIGKEFESGKRHQWGGFRIGFSI